MRAHLRVMALRCWAVLLAVPLITPLSAHAHKPSDSYLTLTARSGERVDVVWHVALRDLDSELALDANDDGRLTWGEVRSRWADMLRFVRPHLRLSRDGLACAVADAPEAPPALIAHTDGQYAVFAWSQRCAQRPGQAWQGVDMDYSLFALSDPTHRGIVRWRRQADGATATVTELGVVVLGAGHPGHAQTWEALADAAPAAAANSALVASAASASGVVAPASASATPVDGRPSPLTQVVRTVREGVDHIAAGADHILFLVSLLLVSVWHREGAPAGRMPMGGWLPRERWPSALGEVLRLVTAFTVAHSLTLALAAFGVLSPPSRWVESLIAFSVLVAALDNLWPILRAPRWAVVFGFGLVHGFGFAGAMQDLGLSAANLAWPLLGFNLGVELGQLMLVALVLPLGLWLRRTAFYRVGVVLPGSAAIAALALVWLVERSTDRIILGWGA